jgi:RimJ/RimL family protein N-acetyltransferase
MGSPIRLDTQRLLLREYLPGDTELAALLAFMSDPEVATHASWGPLSEEEARQVLRSVDESRKADPRLSFGLAIVEKASGELIGHASLNVRNPSTREGEIGYTLARPKWGLGYATEAARELLAFGFGPCGLHRIFATASPANVASHRVLEKIGMKREGLLRKNVLMRGQWRDSVLYAGLEEDFPQG